MRLVVIAVLVAGTVSDDIGQTLAQSATVEPTFEVVSIRRNLSGERAQVYWRPDGGVIIVNLEARQLVWQGYPAVPADTVGMPAWASEESYDVNAVAVRGSASAEDRRAMMRSMLADRFKLIVHFEPKQQPSYNLVLARSDGKLGPSMRATQVDCDTLLSQESAAAISERANAQSPPSLPSVPGAGQQDFPCRLRISGNVMEGDVTISKLAFQLRPYLGRPIVDKTGLKGFHRIRLEFDRFGFFHPESVPSGAPSIFTALQEQLGLKLEPSTTQIDVLVIDRLERPTEN
jgi:uncharacterized protein (TIGR03435 family)